jgi:hypothetical protein
MTKQNLTDRWTTEATTLDSRATLSTTEPTTGRTASTRGHSCPGMGPVTHDGTAPSDCPPRVVGRPPRVVGRPSRVLGRAPRVFLVALVKLSLSFCRLVASERSPGELCVRGSRTGSHKKPSQAERFRKPSQKERFGKPSQVAPTKVQVLQRGNGREHLMFRVWLDPLLQRASALVC